MFPAIFDPPCSYTVFAILHKEFTEIVLPGLDLSGADNDDTRFKLECLIRDVLVTRNWVSHETLSVKEVKRGMQSLVDTLPMLKCDPCLVPPARCAIEEFMREIDDACAPGALPVLSIGSLARLFFMRNCHSLCAAVGEVHEVKKAIETMIDNMGKRKPPIPVTPSLEIHKNIVVLSRHELYHGKSNRKCLSVMVALCSLSSLLRTLGQAHAFPRVVEAAADACDADALQLLVRMRICDEAGLLTAVGDSHRSTYACSSVFASSLHFSLRSFDDFRLTACPYTAVLTDSMARMRHLMWRTVPLQCPAACSIVIADKTLRGRIMQLLNIVKLVPNAATCSEREAVSWLMTTPSQLSALAKAAKCSVPATDADVVR